MYLNITEVAESFGVSEGVIEDWIRREGLPHTPDRGRLLFDRARVAEWASGRGLAARAGFLAPDRARAGGGAPLSRLFEVGGIWRDVAPAEAMPLFGKIALRLPGLNASAAAFVAGRLVRAGGVTVAPIGRGFALPHPAQRLALGRDCGLVALILLSGPLEFSEPAADSEPVTRLLFFIAPSARLHLDLLAGLSRLVASPLLCGALASGAGDDAIMGAVREFEGGRTRGGIAPIGGNE